MGSIELDPYVRRLAALRETRPSASRSETISWVLWPLLSELGWELEHARSGTSLGLLDNDGVLCVGTNPPTPALIVAGEASTDPLSADRIETIAGTMTTTGIDRALYANGREFLFLAGTGDDRLRIAAADLPSRAEAVTLYSHGNLRAHCADLDPAARSSRRLAISRDELADSITTLLETRLGPAGSPDERAVAEFLDAVGCRAIDSTAVTGSLDEVSATAADAAPDTAASIESERAASTPDGAERTASPGGQADTMDRETVSYPASVAPEDDPDGEYVARVFNERGSIGAVGHSTSAGALAESASYFFERGLSGIRVPWAPEEGAIVINEEPVDDTGNRWSAYEQLQNGLYVNTSGSVADRANRVQALADRAGLRVMLTGDWSGKTG